jgi:hypothetical protein
MWQVVPDARLEAEHHYPHEFWDPIDRYRRATALAAAPAEPSEGDVGDTLGSSA